MGPHPGDQPSSVFSPPDIQPIVIPQTSKTLQGVRFSPFSRVYPTCLLQTSPPISKDNFVQIIDDLNEAFIASPFLQALNTAGNIAGLAPSLVAQIVGSSVALGADAGSAATSYTRTRAFVKTINASVFAPRGLQLRVLSTKDMLNSIGVNSSDFNLPPLPDYDHNWAEGQEASVSDPRIRWLQALEGRIATLDWNVPEIVELENWLKKAGSWQSKRQGEKQTTKIMERQRKARTEQDGEVQEEIQKTQQKLQDIREKMLQVEAKAERKTEKKKEKEHKFEEKRLKGIEKLEEDVEKERRKLEKKLEKLQVEKEDKQRKLDRKDQKVIQKIRWIIILPSVSGVVRDEDIDGGVEEIQQWSQVEPAHPSKWPAESSK
jgi:hypothetical protein